MSNWIKRWLAILLPLILTGTVFGMDELQSTVQKVREALLKTDYYAEYTQTTYRFGRRQEEMVHEWVKKDYVIKQIQAPSWQWGETIIQNTADYYYYIPEQKSCLKIAKKVSKSKNRLSEWDSWLKKADKVEEASIAPGRTVQAISGNISNVRFKLSVDHLTFLPVSLEIYRNNLVTKTIVFQKTEELRNFKLSQMIPTGDNIKWYSDESLFWQEVSIPRVQRGVNFTIIQPSYLPSGFVFKEARLKELSGATVVHLIYENPGKQILSIFEREKLSENQKMGLNSLKSVLKDGGNEVNAHQWFKNQVHLVIFGPISVNEIKKVAQSM